MKTDPAVKRIFFDHYREEDERIFVYAGGGCYEFPDLARAIRFASSNFGSIGHRPRVRISHEQRAAVYTIANK